MTRDFIRFHFLQEANFLLPVGKLFLSCLLLLFRAVFNPQVDTMSNRRSIDPCDKFNAGGDTHDDDVLSTAASDSEKLMVDLCSSLSPSEEKHTSPSYNEDLDVLTHAVDKLWLEWDCEPTISLCFLETALFGAV